MNNESLLTMFGSIVLSSGICSFLLQHFVKQALSKAEERKDTEKRERQRRFELTDQRDHALSLVLFWLNHGVESYERETGTHHWNGDLHKAFEELQEAESELKEFDRQQLARLNEK